MKFATLDLAKRTAGIGTGSGLNDLRWKVLKLPRKSGWPPPCAFAALTVTSWRLAQSSQAHITGMAHMAYYVSDLKKARDYYEGFLGFQEAFTIKNADGSDHIVFIKINDRQFIELYAGKPDAATDYGYIHDAGFETNDAKGMRDHLASIGVKVPEKVDKDEAGNLSFNITEPSGFTINIVQYLAASKTGLTKGKFIPATRISDHIDHIGLLIKDKDETWKFYNEAFGFSKDGDGSKMAVPNSPDRFEPGRDKYACRSTLPCQGSHLLLAVGCAEDDRGSQSQAADHRVSRCHRRHTPVGQRKKCCRDL